MLDEEDSDMVRSSCASLSSFARQVDELKRAGRWAWSERLAHVLKVLFATLFSLIENEQAGPKRTQEGTKMALR